MKQIRLKKSEKPFNLSVGERGEMIGWQYLVRQGYQIIEKNYRCKLGEIDVIAKKNNRICFIEIKTRTQTDFGLPEESVHAVKQGKIIKLAQWYLKDKKINSTPVSFDVLGILFLGQGDPRIRLVENAFELS